MGQMPPTNSFKALEAQQYVIIIINVKAYIYRHYTV